MSCFFELSFSLVHQGLQPIRTPVLGLPACLADFKVGSLSIWGAVLMDFGVDYFLFPRLSIVSSGRGKIMGGPKLRILGLGKGTLRGTEGKVVVLKRRG